MTNNRKRGSRPSTVRKVSEPVARPTSGAGKSSLPAPVSPTEVIPSTRAQNEFGRVFDRAMAGTDVAIAKHNVVRAVLISVERYRKLVQHETLDLDTLASRFEQLYASMQQPEVQAATERALRATPAEMGKAAVSRARRSGRRPAGARKKR